MAPAVSIRVWPCIIALYRHLRRALGPDVFTSLFRRFVVLLKFLRSKWKIWYGKQRRSKPPSSKPGTSEKVELSDRVYERVKGADAINFDQMVIPLNNISCSLYPYGTGLHDSSRSSQVLNESRSSHNLGIISRSRNASWFSHHAGANNVQSPLGDGYTFTVEPTSPRRTYSMSSPELTRPHAAALHEAILQRHRPRVPPQSRPHSQAESIQLLSPGEVSNSRIHTRASESPIGQSPELPFLGAVGTSSQTYSDDLEIPPLDNGRIYPVAPGNFQRYEKRRRIPKKATRVKMKPMVIDFSDHLDPPGWALCTHPEGACYFYNAAKRIFTDADLYDPAFLQRISRHIEVIETFITINHISIPEETDLVLDINLNDNGDYVTDYYFANHQLRIIFFLDHYSSEYLPKWEEIQGVNSGRHLRHQIETQYWEHCIAYPNALQLTDNLVCELRDIVLHFIGDSMTSPYATSPYTLDDLYKILSLTDSLKENVGKPYDGCTSLLSSADSCSRSVRLPSTISFRLYLFIPLSQAHLKFLHFHGQPEARLNRDQSIHGTRTNRRTWFIRTLSIFLFSAPDVHLRTLQKMWVDGIMHRAVWETSLKRLNDEWREFILYATVLLNANVAFLGTPRAEALPTALVASYFSIGTSIGSIVLGLLLVRQNQTKSRDTAVDAQHFLRSRSHFWFGLETLAIMFSLPYALLMWSMVSFLAAFLILCFQDSSTVVRATIGSLSAVITVLVAWCIWTSWEKQPDSDAITPQESLPFEEDNSEGRSKNFTFEVVPESTEEESHSLTLGLGFPLSFAWLFFPRRRRGSFDSDDTAVEAG